MWYGMSFWSVWFSCPGMQIPPHRPWGSWRVRGWQNSSDAMRALFNRTSNTDVFSTLFWPQIHSRALWGLLWEKLPPLQTDKIKYKKKSGGRFSENSGLHQVSRSSILLILFINYILLFFKCEIPYLYIVDFPNLVGNFKMLCIEVLLKSKNSLRTSLYGLYL